MRYVLLLSLLSLQPKPFIEVVSLGWSVFSPVDFNVSAGLKLRF